MAGDSTAERFKALVRSIDRVSKRGDHRGALAILPDLLAVEPHDSRLSKKKSHFITALAYRAYQAGDHDSALAFLDVADREIPDGHITPFLREERATIRKAASVR
ncbi:MAG: hypothetical protein HY557_05055 [Euryarchaeota archaeon]|nr:hypothetical protein [Euryarchaeota archaeon]